MKQAFKSTFFGGKEVLPNRPGNTPISVPPSCPASLCYLLWPLSLAEDQTTENWLFLEYWPQPGGTQRKASQTTV